MKISRERWEEERGDSSKSEGIYEQGRGTEENDEANETATSSEWFPADHLRGPFRGTL